MKLQEQIQDGNTMANSTMMFINSAIKALKHSGKTAQITYIEEVLSEVKNLKKEIKK